MKSFPSDVVAELGCYVYLYINPLNNEIFYIGKGRGNRCFDHLDEVGEKRKHQIIKEIRDAGQEPRIEVLSHQLSDQEARLVEAAAIDLLHDEHLSNEIKGWGGSYYGRMSVEEIKAQYCSKPSQILKRHSVVLIHINQSYRASMNKQELYEITRGVWTRGANAPHPKYAFAVFRGVVREVYEIAGWFPAGSTAYFYRDGRDEEDVNVGGRWEFVGCLADDEIRNRYLFTSIKEEYPSAGNPIRYVNCE